MSNVQITGYVAMSVNIAVVICWLFVICCSQGFSKAFKAPPEPGKILKLILPKKLTKNLQFRKTLLTGGLVFKFLMALLDSVFGKN